MEDPSGIVPQLQNVMFTVVLGCKLDLKQIALHARNAEYNPKRFAAVILRIREPKTTAHLFATGKMVCTGAKSEDDALLAARKFVRIVQKLGFPATLNGFTIHNIMGSCDVKFPIKLEALADSHRSFARYEPELFPALHYMMLLPKVTVTIYTSGKVTFSGAKQRTDIYCAFEKIYPILQTYRKGGRPAAAPLAALPLPEPLVAKDRAELPGINKMETAEDLPRLPPPTPAHPGLPPPTPAHPGLLP